MMYPIPARASPPQRRQQGPRRAPSPARIMQSSTRASRRTQGRRAAPGTPAARISLWPIPRRNRAPRLSGKTNPMNTSFLFPMLGPRSQSAPSSRLRVCLANRSRSCLPDAAPCQFRVAAALFAFSPHDRTTSQRNAPMPSPTPRRIPTFLPSSHGRRRPPAIASACTASTFRPNPDASAESFAARPS